MTPPDPLLMAKNFQLAVEKIGSKAALARLLGITKGAIQQWEIVPVLRVPDVSRLTGIPREDLRPDFYGPLEVPDALSQEAPSALEGEAL